MFAWPPDRDPSCIGRILLDACWAQSAITTTYYMRTVLYAVQTTACVVQAAFPSYRCAAVGCFSLLLFVCCSRLFKWLQKKKKLYISCVGPLACIRKNLVYFFLSFFFFQLLSVCAVFRSPSPPPPLFDLQKKKKKKIPLLRCRQCS